MKLLMVAVNTVTAASIAAPLHVLHMHSVLYSRSGIKLVDLINEINWINWLMYFIGIHDWV